MDWSDVEAGDCSVTRTVDLLGDGWSVLVLRDVFNGVRRFDDLTAHLGISRSVLTDRLARLVDAGVLERRPYREPGDRERFEYRLTGKGRDLQTVLVALMDYGDRWLRHEDGGPPVVLRHDECDTEVHARLVCDHGHVVTDRRTVRLDPLD
ncbi:MAG: helix-turn-helix transcriptional regulator [Actinobacteria bacterium]|nr:helix-turn-helix transcriptional regulator [Actinomycetota bacterium]